jgi:hypothetical protein
VKYFEFPTFGKPKTVKKALKNPPNVEDFSFYNV